MGDYVLSSDCPREESGSVLLWSGCMFSSPQKRVGVCVSVGGLLTALSLHYRRCQEHRHPIHIFTYMYRMSMVRSGRVMRPSEGYRCELYEGPAGEVDPCVTSEVGGALVRGVLWDSRSTVGEMCHKTETTKSPLRPFFASLHPGEDWD